METIPQLPDRSRSRIWANRAVALIAVAALCVTAVLWFSRNQRKDHRLTLRAGDPGGHRYEIARILRYESLRHGLKVDLLPSQGSQSDYEDLLSGKLDLALVGGEIGHDRDEVRQVATLVSEPLHLFVRNEIAGDVPEGLRGKRISIGGKTTGTRRVATKVMNFIGLRAGTDFVDEAYIPSQMRELTDEQLPDAFFVLSPLPWRPGTRLVRDHGYRLVELPYGEALSLSDREIHDAVIPAFSYSVNPPVPEKTLHTVATPMLVVANSHVPIAAIERLMEVLFESDFSRRANLPPLDPRAVTRMHDFLIHPGTLAYLKKGEPIVNGEVLGTLENLRSFLVSAAVSVFLLWRWYRSRQLINFETYFDAVTELEQDAYRKRHAGQLDSAELDQLFAKLSTIKADVLEKHAAGNLNGEEELMSFLIHVGDVRTSLNRMGRNLFVHAAGDSIST